MVCSGISSQLLQLVSAESQEQAAYIEVLAFHLVWNVEIYLVSFLPY